jgi:hypothetical protein
MPNHLGWRIIIGALSLIADCGAGCAAVASNPTFEAASGMLP